MRCTVLGLLRLLIAPSIFVACATGAAATTITFDALTYLELPQSGVARVYEESGYEVTPNDSGDFGSYGSGGLHIEVCCGPYNYGANLRRAGGGLFSVLSLDFLHYPSSALVHLSSHYISLTGFQSDVTVATLTGGSAFQGTVNFGSIFQSIDRLLIRAFIPGGYDDFGDDLHFNVDNIVVSAIAPVPLPATILSLLAALGAMVFLRSHRRSFS